MNRFGNRNSQEISPFLIPERKATAIHEGVEEAERWEVNGWKIVAEGNNKGRMYIW